MAITKSNDGTLYGQTFAESHQYELVAHFIQNPGIFHIGPNFPAIRAFNCLGGLATSFRIVSRNFARSAIRQFVRSGDVGQEDCQFFPKVFSRVEVRALFKSPKFFNTNF